MRTKSGNDDQGYGVRSGVEFCDEPAVVVGGVILRDRLPSEQSEPLRGVRGSCIFAASDHATVGVTPSDAADVQLSFARGVQQSSPAAAAYGVASSQPASSSTAISRPAKRGSRSSRSSRSVFKSA